MIIALMAYSVVVDGKFLLKWCEDKGRITVMYHNLSL